MIPLWANGKVLTYGPVLLLGLILLWVTISHSKTITKLKTHNEQLHAEVYKKEQHKQNLQKASFEYQKEAIEAQNDNNKLEAKLSDALEKLKNLEEFFDRHQLAHKQHADEKALWEKEKKFLHNEIESIRDNFRDTRQLSMEGNTQQLAEEAAKKAAEQQASSGNPLAGGGGSKQHHSTGMSMSEELPDADVAKDKKEEASGDVEAAKGAEEAANAKTDDGIHRTKTGKDLTASIVKQFKHHRFSYGGQEDQEAGKDSVPM